MDDLGSRCYSTHNHIESFTPGETMGKAMKLNQILGTRYVVMASSPRWARAMEGWKRLCGQLSTANDQLLPPERQSPAQPGWRFTGTARQIRKRCSTPPADWGSWYDALCPNISPTSDLSWPGPARIIRGHGT